MRQNSASKRSTPLEKRPPIEKKTLVKSKVPTREEIIARKREATKRANELSLRHVRKSPGTVPEPRHTAPPVVVQHVVGNKPKPGPLPRKKTEKSSASASSFSGSAVNNGFEASANSLKMLKSNTMSLGSGRVSTMGGRPSMRGKRFAEPVRCSMLPLGINVFDTETSEADKQKVYDYMKSLKTSTSKKPMLSSSSEEDDMAPSYSAAPTPSRGRLVRFQPDEGMIQEGRESLEDSDADALAAACAPSSSGTSAFFSAPAPKEPQSILKKKRPVWAGSSNAAPTPSFPGFPGFGPSPSINGQTYTAAVPEETPRRNSGSRQRPASRQMEMERDTVHDRAPMSTPPRMGLASPARSRVSHVTRDPSPGRARVSHVTGDVVDELDEFKLFALIHKKRALLESLPGHMVDDLLELMGDVKQHVADREAALQLNDSNSSSSFRTLPDDAINGKKKASVKRKNVPSVGFRAVVAKKNLAEKQKEAARLRADQEVMLLNENRDPSGHDGSEARVLRHRSRNPMAEELGGSSPFVPIPDVSGSRRASSARKMGQVPKSPSRSAMRTRTSRLLESSSAESDTETY